MRGQRVGRGASDRGVARRREVDVRRDGVDDHLRDLRVDPIHEAKVQRRPRDVVRPVAEPVNDSVPLADENAAADHQNAVALPDHDHVVVVVADHPLVGLGALRDGDHRRDAIEERVRDGSREHRRGDGRVDDHRGGQHAVVDKLRYRPCVVVAGGFADDGRELASEAIGVAPAAIGSRRRHEVGTILAHRVAGDPIGLGRCPLIVHHRLAVDPVERARAVAHESDRDADGNRAPTAGRVDELTQHLILVQVRHARERPVRAEAAALLEGHFPIPALRGDRGDDAVAVL